MDLGLKGKVAMVAGASRGLGYAVAEALAREGALVSIASRDEQAIAAAAQRIGGDTLAVPVDVRSAEAIEQWTAATERSGSAASICCSPTRAGRPPAPPISFDDRGVAGRGRPAAVQHAPHGPRRRCRRCRRAAAARSCVHVVVGQGADPEPRAVDGAARVGVGAGEDAGARARARRRSASTRSSPAASTPTACGSSTRSPPRSRASPPKRPSRSRSPRSRLGRYGEIEEYRPGRRRSCSRLPPAT